MEYLTPLLIYFGITRFLWLTAAFYTLGSKRINWNRWLGSCLVGFCPFVGDAYMAAALFSAWHD